ncbi:MAG: glycosyltransferase, partial [Candidatus Margulisiibacteriota bacterium]
DVKDFYPFCSVIVPTHNRSKYLKAALQSVLNQSVPFDKYELLIIDDGSIGDDTKKVVWELQRLYPERAIRYYYQENAGPAAARNLGIRNAKGEIIFFTDDDCIVPSNWMQALLDGYYRYPDAVGVGGWFVPPQEALKSNMVAKFIYYTAFYNSRISPLLLSHEIISNDPLACFGMFAYNTANISFRRNILERTGGFREEFRRPGYEDSDLALRILHNGGQLLYIPLHVEHVSHLDAVSFVKLCCGRGASFQLFMKLNKNILEEIRPNLSLRNIYPVSILLKHLLFRPYKFMTLLRFLSFRLGWARAESVSRKS